MRVEELHTPCYVIDEELLEANLKILKGVSDRTGCKILLAQKAFSNYAVYPLIGKYLSGTAASGLFEARLCKEEMPGEAENHIFSPAYREEEMEEILQTCDHIVFNSIKQLFKYGKRAKEAGLSVGLRINPEKSTQEGHAIYDTCAPGSRLGCTVSEFRAGLRQELQKGQIGELLDGLHFHTLCEQNADALEVTLQAAEEKFGDVFPYMKWLNFGGGHHITRPDYDIPLLERCIRRIRETYGVQVYLEPGEAVALNAGFLISKILEIQDKEPPTVILDVSAACHMPDVLEMPYTPPLAGAKKAGEAPYTYLLGGPTCLAGDVIGTYAFEEPLTEGGRLIFEDMAIYSMVKNNTFNGMPLPDIYLKKGTDYRLWKRFSYEDFKYRL